MHWWPWWSCFLTGPSGLLILLLGPATHTSASTFPGPIVGGGAYNMFAAIGALHFTSTPPGLLIIEEWAEWVAKQRQVRVEDLNSCLKENGITAKLSTNKLKVIQLVKYAVALQ